MTGDTAMYQVAQRRYVATQDMAPMLNIEHNLGHLVDHYGLKAMCYFTRRTFLHIPLSQCLPRPMHNVKALHKIRCLS